MKKICFVTTTSITLKTFVVETAIKLYDSGEYDITFICDHDEEFAGSLPKYIHFRPVSMKRGVSFGGIGSIFVLTKIFNKQKFDLVQYSTPNAAFYASIAAFFSRIPIRLYCQWGIRYVAMQGFKRTVFKQIEKVCCFLSTDIRSVSNKNREFAIQEGLYKANTCCVLGHGGTIGVDLSNYDIKMKHIYRNDVREQYKLIDHFIFGFVGRFSRDKGSNELLGGFKRITEKNLVKLLCVGPIEASDDVDNDLFRWAKNNPNVIFTGYIDSSELRKYYAAMDCFVHPTYREGFGMVIQEAAAMACPIITTNIPGASEVMEGEKSCVLIEPRSVDFLVDAMVRVMSDADMRESMGKNARERVEQYFERNVMLENQRKDYESLLKKEVTS